MKYARARLAKWYSGWESACQWRGHGVNPWPGKVHVTDSAIKARVPQPLGLCPGAPQPRTCALRPKRNLRAAVTRSPLLAAPRESLCAATRVQHTHAHQAPETRLFPLLFKGMKILLAHRLHRPRAISDLRALVCRSLFYDHGKDDPLDLKY